MMKCIFIPWVNPTMRDPSCYFTMVDQDSMRIYKTLFGWKDIPLWLPLIGSPVALILGFISEPVIMFKSLLG
jgi:hypothetical protein